MCTYSTISETIEDPSVLSGVLTELLTFLKLAIPLYTRHMKIMETHDGIWNLFKSLEKYIEIETEK